MIISTTVWTQILFACLRMPMPTVPTSSRGSRIRLRTTSGSAYSKYANFPSCSESDWGERYWENYSQLQTIKNTWDPNNVFNHCHSVGSNNNTCCPDFEHSNVNVEQKTCMTTSGHKCVFPFTYMYRTYDRCTYSGFGYPWCATSTNIFGGLRSWAYCDVNTCPVN